MEYPILYQGSKKEWESLYICTWGGGISCTWECYSGKEIKFLVKLDGTCWRWKGKGTRIALELKMFKILLGTFFLVLRTNFIVVPLDFPLNKYYPYITYDFVAYLFSVLTGCPSLGSCTIECLDGATLICLPQSLILSKCVKAAKK